MWNNSYQPASQGFYIDDENSNNLKQELLEGTIGPETKDRRKVTDLPSGIVLLIFLIAKVVLVLCTIPYWRHVDLDDLDEYSKEFNRTSRTTSRDTWDDMGTLIVGMMYLFLPTAAIVIVLCGIFVLLFRYCTKVLVWGILILSLLFFVVLTALLWIVYIKSDSFHESDQKNVCLVMGIIFGIFTLIILCIFTCMFRKIPLVIELFKEAMKAIFSMPIILFEPILTSVCLVGYVCYFTFVLIRLVAAESSNFVMFNIYFNIFMLYWVSNFIMGCQHMVIAGSVAAYFFTRDKSTMRSPVNTSFFNLVRFHLGTVAIGSLLVSLAEMIKATIRNGGIAGVIGRCLCQSLINFLRYLSRNAYIYTAIHGKPFLYSGKQVVKLLCSNIINVAALNSIGGYIIFLCVLLITGISIFAGSLIGNTYGPIGAVYTGVFAFILSILLCNCLFSVIQMSIDTIFLCFCEDSLLNNGSDRPYLMSRNLMQFIDHSKKILGNKALQKKS